MSELRKNPVKTILEGDFANRVHDISSLACSFEVASEHMNRWRQDGRLSVFNAGTYDILTRNHILGLVQCRTLGAMMLLGVDKVETDRQQRTVHEVAASNAVHLMVTLDTDTALRDAKSRRPDKGAAPKPTLGWDTRAAMLAMQSIPSADYTSRRHAVDFITRHGPDSCPSCAIGECTNRDNALMTAGLQPDLVVVNADSLNTVRDIKSYQEEGLLPHTQLAVVCESDNEYFDPILQGPVTTTAIIKYVRS